MSVVLPEEYTVMVNSEELHVTGTTRHVTLQTRCRVKLCRYNRVRLYLVAVIDLKPIE